MEWLNKYSAEYNVAELIKMWYFSKEDIDSCLKDWHTIEQIFKKIQEILLQD
jgi:hypothetical protein